MKKVTILGAGISGLVCGLEFLKKGWKVRIFEKDSIPGGMAKTKEREGYKYDMGPHIFHTYDKNTVKYWKENFPGIMVEKHFFSKNVKKGILYDYPLSWESIENLPEELRNKIKEEMRYAKKSDLTKKAKNYKEYVIGLVGPTLQKMFFEEYPTKIWGIPTTDMSTNWAPKRIDLRKKCEAFFYDQWCGVARGGSGTITNLIAKEIKDGGGEIFLKHEVKGIDITNNVINKIKFSNEEKINIEKGEIVISTISINNLANLFSIDSNLRFRGVILANVIVKKEEVLPQGVDWLYYGNPEVIFSRITEQKKFNPENFRHNETLICCEVQTGANESLYKKEDHFLIERIKEDLISAGLIKRDEVIKVLIERIPEVYPIQRVGFENERMRILSKLEEISNLHITGAIAEFGYFDMQILFCKSRDLVDLITKPKIEQEDKKEVVHTEFNKEISIENKKIGKENSVFIIAEIGMNHNGSLELAKELIKEARGCGCDAVKFQSFKAESRVSAKAKAAKYAEETTGMEEKFYQMFKRLELSRENHFELMKYAREEGIIMLSTPSDEENADLLEEIGVNIYKISSMDLVNLPLIKHIAEKQKPIILSTGMGNLGEIEDALNTIRKTGNQNVILLHCISSYPSPAEEMNLRAIKTLAQAFNVPVGLSDHSIGSLIPSAATVLGAKVIEKHFTLDNRLEGPDQVFSATPEVMKKLIQDIRTLEAALGDGIKRPKNIEYRTAQLFKKSIFAKRDISYGEKITKEMIEMKGPALGIQPKFMDIIIGRNAQKNILKDHPITWGDV